MLSDLGSNQLNDPQDYTSEWLLLCSSSTEFVLMLDVALFFCCFLVAMLFQQAEVLSAARLQFQNPIN